MIAFFGTGLMHSMYAKPHAILDMMYADLVVDVHLLSIARVGLMKEKLTKPEVVLMCSYPFDEFDLENQLNHLARIQKKLPFSKCFGDYNIEMVPCYYNFVLRVLAYQVVPSLLVDLLLRASKIRPIAMSSQRKMFVANKEMGFFTTRSFQSAGITHLGDLVVLSKESVFSVDSLFQQTNDVCLENAYGSFIAGTRKYLLRDDDSTLPAARRRYKM